MGNRYWRKMMEQAVSGLAWTAFALASFIAYDTMTFDDRLPIQSWGQTEARNSPVQAGDNLIVHIEREKVRADCPVASARQIINEDGQPVPIPASVWTGGDPDADAIDVAYPIPKATPAGSYVLRVFLTYTCPDFVWTTQQPDTRFRVVD